MIKSLILYICFVCLAVESLSQTDTVIGPSRLRDTSVLKAVTVHGRKALIKPSLDGFVYHAENDAAIASGNAIDVLRRIPLVTIGMDGSPRIQGSNSIRVFIDNKPSDIFASSVADALRQIAAEDIARVEVITQPSARYDAEGTDAVINIITKKSRYDGMTGRLSMAPGNRSQQAGASGKWRKGALIASLEGNWYRYNNTMRNTLERREINNNGGSLLQQEKDSRNVWNGYVIAPGVTWMPDSLNTFTAGYRYRKAWDWTTSVQHSVVTVHDSVSETTRHINNYSGRDGHTWNTSYTNVSANKKREVNVQLFYFNNREHLWYDLNQTRHGIVNYLEKNDNTTALKELSGQADWMQTLDTVSKLEAGIKAFWRTSGTENLFDRFDFLQGEYYPDPVRTTHFTFDRSIYAGYINYILSLKSWSIRVGGRFEQTRLYADFKDTALHMPDFNNWLPNVLISKMLTEQQTLKLSYTQKVIRPYLASLNPTVNYIDSFNIEYGNPDLQPIITHSFQLVYQFNKNKFFGGVSLSADVRNNAIEEVQLVKQGISETTYRNMGANRVYRAGANLSYNGNRHVSASAAVTVQYTTIKSEALQLANNGVNVFGNGRVAYKFKKDWQVETAVHIDPPNIRLQGYGGGWFYFSLVVNKKWWNDRLQASFTMENFLTKYQHRKEVLRTAQFDQVVVNRYPVQFLKLGLSYRFGKKDIKEPVKRVQGEAE